MLYTTNMSVLYNQLHGSRNALQFVFVTFTCIILPDLPYCDGDMLYEAQDTISQVISNKIFRLIPNRPSSGL